LFEEVGRHQINFLHKKERKRLSEEREREREREREKGIERVEAVGGK